ncbi:MAG TPA: hypothetical protein PLJ62_02655 [Thermoflexales bacterium]|nr:hypothetical protein [Thermoflexales bacterium]HQW35326.1 hypothetical protein [Thermoflexales bacterium]HQZ20638.1 hypothetical protein [Thermoflexales bacterium]HQZ99073.1 hypothetical protein [Thermoflexales bacterium]
METFYSQLAAISFALLGLWWVVVQMKYKTWTSAPGRLITAYAVSASFVALGVLSLIAIMDDPQSQIWRLGSGLGAALGILATLFALMRGHLSSAQRVGEGFVLVLFVVMGLLSFVTTPLLGLRPVALEGLLSVGTLALTVHVIWQFFVEKAE